MLSFYKKFMGLQNIIYFATDNYYFEKALFELTLTTSLNQIASKVCETGTIFQTFQLKSTTIIICYEFDLSAIFRQ